MQPDDFEFLAEWNPPAHFPGNTGFALSASSLLPNIQRLRQEGAIMTRAYTASPMCGTSRYSTLTGRYPSRSAYSRTRQQPNTSVSTVTIPTTKLIDIDDGDGADCSRNNLAALMKANGYRTGFMGKWHLGLGGTQNRGPATYAEERTSIQSCGFDTAEAIYWENLRDDATPEFLHNLEHMVDQALQFIDSTGDEEEFFMYFNPTAPHSSGSVLESLTEFSCRDTPQGLLDTEPVIPGMTAGVGCAAYRQTILERAQGDVSNEVLGSIWVDDMVGALLRHLQDVGKLDNTLFLFQLDHGQEGKSTLYEPGIRIAQFVHYPNQIPAGTVFSGLVSTIDIAPTVAAFANITSSSPGGYYTDGTSWKNRLIQEGNVMEDRCVIAELDQDRVAVCTCEKVLQIGDPATSSTERRSRRFGLASTGNLQLCDENGDYITGPNSSPEAVHAAEGSQLSFNRAEALLECHNKETNPHLLPFFGICKELEIIYGNFIYSGGTLPPTMTSNVESPSTTNPGTLPLTTSNTMSPTTTISSTLPPSTITSNPSPPTSAPNNLPPLATSSSIPVAPSTASLLTQPPQAQYDDTQEVDPIVASAAASTVRNVALSILVLMVLL